MNFTEKLKDNTVFIGGCVLVVITLLAIMSRVTAINLEEKVLGADKIIVTNVVARNSKMPGFVQLVERGVEQECITLTQYATARNENCADAFREAKMLADEGEFDAAYVKLNAVMEAVPTLTAIHGYEDAALELTLCENRIEDARLNRIDLTEQYRSHVRTWGILLAWVHYTSNPVCMEYNIAVDENMTDVAPMTFTFN